MLAYVDDTALDGQLKVMPADTNACSGLVVTLGVGATEALADGAALALDEAGAVTDCDALAEVVAETDCNALALDEAVAVTDCDALALAVTEASTDCVALTLLDTVKGETDCVLEMDAVADDDTDGEPLSEGEADGVSEGVSTADGVSEGVPADDGVSDCDSVADADSDGLALGDAAVDGDTLEDTVREPVTVTVGIGAKQAAGIAATELNMVWQPCPVIEAEYCMLMLVSKVFVARQFHGRVVR